jgi:hypothetical protein
MAGRPPSGSPQFERGIDQSREWERCKVSDFGIGMRLFLVAAKAKAIASPPLLDVCL